MRRLSISVLASVFLVALGHDAGAAEPQSQPYNWTGFYVGGNAGYGWGSRDAYFTGDGNNGAGSDFISRVFDGPASFNDITRPQRINLEDVIGGGQLGYNWQFAPAFVAGLEADIQTSRLKGNATTVSPTIPLQASSHQNLKWFGTARARLGYLVNDRVLVYGTGGFAYGEVDLKGDFFGNWSAFAGGTAIFCNGTTTCLSGEHSVVKDGWTVGGGVEWAFTNIVTLKIEYLHIEFPDSTVILTTHPPATGDGFVSIKFRNIFDIVRAGLNVRF